MIQYGLLNASANTIRRCLDLEIPDSVSNLEGGPRAYGRILELQYELCQAISLLCRSGLLRPAHAALRSLLESMATLVWASEKQRYMDLLNSSDGPGMKEVLDRIGWGSEYDTTYNWLSAFVHGGMEEAEFYRQFETFSADGPAPEVTPDGEFYAVLFPDGALGLHYNLMSPEQAEQEYGPYLSVKPLDIVCCGLAELHGVGVAPPAWWPQNDLQQMLWLSNQFRGLYSKLLWPRQQST